MAIPSLTVYLAGGGTANVPVTADQLNSFLQTAQNTAQLRTITGLSGMVMLLQGVTQPSDGNGGFFQWNATSTQPDDNYNYIQPPGSTGQWTRIAGV